MSDFREIIIITAVPLLVVRLEKLPWLIKEVVKWVAMVRHFVTDPKGDMMGNFNSTWKNI